MYVPDTFRSGAPFAPHWPRGYTASAYMPAGPPVAYTRFVHLSSRKRDSSELSRTSVLRHSSPTTRRESTTRSTTLQASITGSLCSSRTRLSSDSVIDLLVNGPTEVARCRGSWSVL